MEGKGVGLEGRKANGGNQSLLRMPEKSKMSEFLQENMDLQMQLDQWNFRDTLSFMQEKLSTAREEANKSSIEKQQLLSQLKNAQSKCRNHQSWIEDLERQNRELLSTLDEQRDELEQLHQ